MDGEYSTVSADGGATVVSDVARVVGPLVVSTGDWGEVGGWNRLRGCSAGSSRVFRCSWVVVCVPERCGAGDTAVVDDAAGLVDA